MNKEWKFPSIDRIEGRGWGPGGWHPGWPRMVFLLEPGTSDDDCPLLVVELAADRKRGTMNVAPILPDDSLAMEGDKVVPLDSEHGANHGIPNGAVLVMDLETTIRYPERSRYTGVITSLSLGEPCRGASTPEAVEFRGRLRERLKAFVRDEP